MAAEERPWMSANLVRTSALVAMALCVPAALLTVAGPHSGASATRVLPAPVSLGLAAVTACWLLGLWPLITRVPPRRSARAGYYAVLLVLLTVLVAASPWFMVVSWTLAVDAFVLFEARWAFVAIAGSGVALTEAQAGSSVPSSAGSVSLLVVSLVTPLLVAGWYLGRESESRRRLIAELGAANHALTAALESNATLQERIVDQAREAGVHQERQRVAREIHDTLAQTLSAIAAQLEVVVRADDGRGGGPEPGGPERGAEVVGRARLARDLAREGLAEARRSVGALTPGTLVDATLPQALERLAAEWADRTGVAVTVRADEDLPPVPAATQVALFRVAQSALANVTEHAAASRVGLTLSRTDGEVVLDVRDDGVGFDPAQPPKWLHGRGFGLTGVRQRINELGGRVELETAPGAGTALRVVVPLEECER